MKEVFPNIYLIEEVSKFFGFKDATNIYVIAGSDGLIFDGGYGNKRVVKKVLNDISTIKQTFESKNIDFKLTRVIPSHGHSDHISGLTKFRVKLGVKIVLTKEMAEITKDRKSFLDSFRADSYEDYYIINKGFRNKALGLIESKLSYFFWNLITGTTYVDEPDAIIEKDTEILINSETWKIFPSPGHSFDHISLYNEDSGVLFAGDNLFKSISGWLGPPESNLDDYIRTLELYLTLPKLELILPAHGKPITNPKERIKEILAHRKKRIQQVLDSVIDSNEMGITPKGIINHIYTNGNRVIKQIARGWVCLSLKKLEKEELIIRKETKKEILFLSKSKL